MLHFKHDGGVQPFWRMIVLQAFHFEFKFAVQFGENEFETAVAFAESLLPTL
jgi:hypothetical protein